MIFLQEGIGVNVVNAATFPQNDTSAIFHNFRNLDGIVQQISMVTIHHSLILLTLRENVNVEENASPFFSLSL